MTHAREGVSDYKTRTVFILTFTKTAFVGVNHHLAFYDLLNEKNNNDFVIDLKKYLLWIMSGPCKNDGGIMDSK